MHAEPYWLSSSHLIEIHAEQIARYGGPSGIRDEGLLESACAHPQNLWHYEGERDALTLAIDLALAIGLNHPFIDGNKRAATMAMLLFLDVNGFELDAGPDGESLGMLMEALITKRISRDYLWEALAPCIRAAE